MIADRTDDPLEETQMQERLSELVELERDLRTRLDGLRVS